MNLSTTIHLTSFLAHQPLLSSRGKELTRQVPFQRREGAVGTRGSTLAKIAAIDNGNDAVKGAILHAPAVPTSPLATPLRRDSDRGVRISQEENASQQKVGGVLLFDGSMGEDLEALGIGMGFAQTLE